MKYLEPIADNLSEAGWSWGCVSAVGREGRTIWIADAHRGDGERFVVRADEKLSAFIELERAIHKFAVSLSNGRADGKTSLWTLRSPFGPLTHK